MYFEKNNNCSEILLANLITDMILTRLYTRADYRRESNKIKAEVINKGINLRKTTRSEITYFYSD